MFMDTGSNMKFSSLVNASIFRSESGFLLPWSCSGTAEGAVAISTDEPFSEIALFKLTSE